MSKIPAKAAREMAKDAVRRTLSKASSDNDVDQKEISDACGVPAPTVCVWMQRDGAKSPLAADLHNMPKVVAVPLLRDAAQKHGYDLTPSHDAGVDLESVGDLHDVLRECNDVGMRWMSGLAEKKAAGQKMSATARSELLREVREARDALGKLEASLLRDSTDQNLNIA